MMIHDFMLGIHLVGLVVCFFIVYMLGRSENKQKANYMVVTIVCNIISLVGYILELMSSTEEAMLTAVKVQYLGKCFVGSFLLYTFIKYYKWNFPKLALSIIWITNMIMYFVVLTLEYHMCYYSTIDIKVISGHQYL